MKKIIGLLIFGLFLLFSSNSLFADAYDDCFEIERIKAKSDGLGAVASAEQAGKICRAKLGETQSQGNTTQDSATQNNTVGKDGGLFVSVAPVFWGTITEEYRSSNGNFATGNLAPHGAIKSGFGYQLGYKFPEIPFRISYASYNFKAEINEEVRNPFDAKVQNNFVSADWIGSTGLFVGLGTGTGKTEQDEFNLSESGSLFVFTGGYNFNIAENFKIGINLLSSVFEYTWGTTDYTVRTAAWFLNGTFVF